MEKYYHCIETDSILSLEEIEQDYYIPFGDDYETLDDYIDACMTYNNGALMPVSVKLKQVKRELNRKLMLAQKYGYDEYADELADLLEQMDILSKYARSRA